MECRQIEPGFQEDGGLSDQHESFYRPVLAMTGYGLRVGVGTSQDDSPTAGGSDVLSSPKA